MRKKIPISYTKERVVLSDVLPYETALIFSNRYYYKYLIKRNKSLKDDKYKIKHNCAFEQIEGLLFKNSLKTRPFSFNINHKVGDFRELKVIHPQNQLEVINFYEKYKHLILYYCGISPFSIRKPTAVATFTFYNDLLHKKNQAGGLEHTQIEQDDNEYENLKSYFTYQKYSNIHKFFESYQFHRSEKKYNKLKKIDITRCFDSIYTHSISWAILNKSIVKDNVNQSLRTFGGEFDDLMQKLNDNETNGIVIGPEFSRIFAELILQQIDLQLFFKLKLKDENGKNLIHKVDYEIFRYVDDYFIFYNDEIAINRIDKELKLLLASFKLAVNDQKSKIYEKPIITEITLAKQKISDLFTEHLILKNREIQIAGKEEKKTLVYFSSNNVITRFKSIVKETGVEYKDIMNYSLAVLDRKVAKLIRTYCENCENPDINFYNKEFEQGLLQVLDVSFFFYSVSPRVNSTIKLCLIIDKIITFLKKNKTNNYVEPLPSHAKHNIFKKISDEINLILKKNRTTHATQIETLYLLIALGQLRREYRIDPFLLSSYFNLHKPNSELVTTNELNYFSITVLLFYIKNIGIYTEIKTCLKRHIISRFRLAVEDINWRSNTEMVLLLLDCISCPFLNDSLEKNQKDDIILKLDKLHNKVIESVDFNSVSDYVTEVKILMNSIFKCEGFESIKKGSRQKVANSVKLYTTELQSLYGRNVYRHEEILIHTIVEMKRDIKSHVDKYSFKKELLLLAGISNRTKLIEQERFWFIKWTEFDFRLELQAKRSQEVY